MVQWTPFIQTFKNRKYQWVQLAGHSGNFKAGRSQGTVLKKLCPQEENCYTQFSSDSLKEYVPEFQGTLVLDNDESKCIIIIRFIILEKLNLRPASAVSLIFLLMFFFIYFFRIHTITRLSFFFCETLDHGLQNWRPNLLGGRIG